MKYLALIAVGAGLCLAQPYRCDWSVVGAGGGEMASASHRCGATAGQTASGALSGSPYSALIGFWLAELQVGVREAALLPRPAALRTELHAPQPSVFRSRSVIRYSLAADGPVCVAVHDITGRLLRELVNAAATRGTHTVTWDGRDAAGRRLAAGVYLVRFSAGGTRQTERVTLAR